MGNEAPRNSFRSFVLSGERRQLVVTDKESRLGEPGEDDLGRVAVPRSETRRGDHRGGDRHRLNGEAATVRYGKKAAAVELVNLSSGGAMVRGRFKARLWDLVELEFAEGHRLEAAVRWLKGDLVGLEFAHETRIDCADQERAAILLDVIQRSFPDQPVSLDDEEELLLDEPVQEELGNRDVKRHPLIWKGEIYYNHDSNPVRLRNVSEGGALVEVDCVYPLGAEVLLDLGDAGQFFANVQWAAGDQVGLSFVRPFDLACLAKARPEVTPHSWQAPTFLTREAGEDTPWNIQWGRGSIAELRSDLEGYLKR